jgi:hypothetical protein
MQNTNVIIRMYCIFEMKFTIIIILLNYKHNYYTLGLFIFFIYHSMFVLRNFNYYQNIGIKIMKKKYFLFGNFDNNQ